METQRAEQVAESASGRTGKSKRQCEYLELVYKKKVSEWTQVSKRKVVKVQLVVAGRVVGTIAGGGRCCIEGLASHTKIKVPNWQRPAGGQVK